MLTSAEMRHIVWEQLGIRVAPEVTVQQMEDLLHYRVDPAKLPHNPINDMRDSIMAFIQVNRDRLSLPCDGDCYQHGDVMVLNCHNLVRSVNAEGSTEGQDREGTEAGEVVQEGAGRTGQG